VKKFSPIKILLTLLAVAFITHQLISTFYKPISTETAYYHTADNGFDITGIIIRNETFVKSSKDGVLHFMIDDGRRISNGGIIANVYQSEAASITLSQIDTLKSKIKDIEEIVSQNNMEAANLDVANSNVNNEFNNLILSSSFGNFTNVNLQGEELLSALNRRQAILGDTSDFDNQLSILKSELKNLENSLSDPIGKIKAAKSGYFISKIDGYENAFNIDDLSTVTSEFLKKLSKTETEENVVGKIVSDYEWYIAANVPLEKSLSLKEGDSLILRTSVKSSLVLPVTVKKINLSGDGTDAVIIFSCSNMNSELATMRSSSMTVVKQEHSGLRIPKKALRVVDSVRGVYVVNGMQIKFVPVDIVYTGDNFILCEKNDEDGALRLYDQVVVKGKNLYDGKIIS